MNERIFREYDIRGVADKDLGDELIVPLSRAIGTFLRKRGAKSLTLGRDCRVSSDRIARGMREGLVASGLDVLDVGLVPTPLLYFSVIDTKVDGGVMITGSHNPPEHNGFKICSGPSTIFGDDIQAIKHILKEGDFASGKGTIRSTDIRESYLRAIVANIRHPLNLKVVVDSGNGMAGPVAGELFRRLGCQVTELYPELDGRFPNHHPDPTVEENLSSLVKEVRRQEAILGVAFDGDADRIGVVDRDGRAIYGDELLVLYARHILKGKPGAKIISEVKASHRLYQDVERHGGRPIMWKTGHSLIKAKMKQEGALLAGEMSGHMFFNDRYFGYDDAIYAAARLFEIVAEAGKSPGELLKDLPPSFSTPEIRVDCPDDKKFAVVEQAKRLLEEGGFKVNGIDGARVEFEDGWGLVRASNTQPVLVFRFEASSRERLKEIQELIEGTVARLVAAK